MVPILYCRWRGCGKTHERVAGAQPAICPHCRNQAMWTTNRLLAGRFVDPKAGTPRVKYELNFNDKLFLKKRGIQWREEPDV